MNAAENTRFEIGDWIVHYYYGVGKVKDIVEKGLDGNEKTFYKVSNKEIDYWIPIESQDSDHIEPIRSKRDFDEALNVLSKKPQPNAEHHKTRKKRIHDRWLEGDLTSRAELLRDLNGRLKLEKLSFSEKEVLERVKRFFINEWIITNDALTQTKAKKELRSALKISVKKGRIARKYAKE